MEDGSLMLRAAAGPQGDGHPGIPPKFGDSVNDALKLGLRLMRAPRVGMARPAEVLDAWYAPEPPGLGMHDRVSRFGELAREVEKRGVGSAVLKALGQCMNARLGVEGHWKASLNRPANAQEASHVMNGVSEWADGD